MITFCVLINLITLIAIINTIIGMRKSKEIRSIDKYFKLGFLNHMVLGVFGIITTVVDFVLIIKFLP